MRARSQNLTNEAIWLREQREGLQDPCVTTDLEALLTALCVKIDDEIGGTRWMGTPPLLSDSELACLAVAQALLGYHSEARWLRYANRRMSGMFPYLPLRPGYNKRLRSALPLVKRMIRELAMDSDFWFDSHHWIVDSTPVPCAMSRPAVQRSNLAGWAQYGYCASHSRFFWGLRLYLVCTPAGMPVLWALASAKLGEREVLSAMLEVDAGLVGARGHPAYLGQGLRVQAVRTGAHRPAHRAAAALAQAREGAVRRADAQKGPPADRIGQRHPQGAA